MHIAQDFMQKFAAPALSVAIGHNGQITYLGAFGVPSRDSHEHLTASHTFRIASATKPFTSVAISSSSKMAALSPRTKFSGDWGF
jgi:CubicO group peptidase (beta-lactamase class C family)